MSDMMLKGVLRMPIEMAMGTDLSRAQFYDRAQQAMDEIERLQREVDIQKSMWAEAEGENERLRAALERIAEYELQTYDIPTGDDAIGMRKIAREALK